jgi:hypothetical protein
VSFAGIELPGVVYLRFPSTHGTSPWRIRRHRMSKPPTSAESVYLVSLIKINVRAICLFLCPFVIFIFCYVTSRY